jgi:uncharacterized protein (TIGR00251 family)
MATLFVLYIGGKWYIGYVPMKQAETSDVAVHVFPKSAGNQVEGQETDAAGKAWLKVRLTATPEDGKANDALLRLLAKTWGCAPSRLSIVRGETSRHKIVRKI